MNKVRSILLAAHAFGAMPHHYTHTGVETKNPAQPSIPMPTHNDYQVGDRVKVFIPGHPGLVNEKTLCVVTKVNRMTVQLTERHTGKRLGWHHVSTVTPF